MSSGKVVSLIGGTPAVRALKRFAAATLGALLLTSPVLAATAVSPAPAAVKADVAAAPAPVAAAPVVAAPAAAPAAAAPAINPNDPHFQIAPGGYTPMKPTAGKGMPVDGGYTFQPQYSPNGQYALKMHNALLMPVITVITLFVLGLLLFVVAKFNRKASPVASKVSHNTTLEVLWTGIPVIILVVISVPSLKLLAKLYTPPPANAVTIKATGNQWFWTFTYPDNGGVEVISNILTNDKADAAGEPRQLAADTRMVVPAGEHLRIQTTGADVIHAFAVPSLWFKLDAVPGKINERDLFINEPGVYYGQCSELCGARHGYMPIVVEALPRAKFNAWVIAQGGKIDGAPGAAAGAGAGAAPAVAAVKPAGAVALAATKPTA